MMQEPNSFSRFTGLPKFGAALSEVRAWERSFRDLATEAGFTEVNLPVVAPLSCFKSRQTGESTLAPGPRFTDTQGVEWAMRSDMTAFTAQFVLEHASEISFPARLAYSGKVFSYVSGPGSRSSHSFGVGVSTALENYEFGAEIVGLGELTADLEILALAVRSAYLFGYKNLMLVVGDSRISQALFSWLRIHEPADLRAAKMEQLQNALARLDLCSLAEALGNSPLKDEFERVLSSSPVKAFLEQASLAAPTLQFVFDPWVMRPQSFYSGLTFEIFAQNDLGQSRWVGGGGRYDTLYSQFGRDLPAVGFMLRDPAVTGMAALGGSIAGEATQPPARLRPLRIALPKGRLVKVALEAFAKVGIEPETNPDNTRKLVLASKCGLYEFLFVKNADVTAYLEQNVADVALCGSDVLDEHPAPVYRPATFGFGQCRICLAGKPEFKTTFAQLGRARVASKYVNIARDALRSRGISCEIFPLQGSVELASVIDFSDAIVDLVETGNTLRENGLIVFEDLGRTRVQMAVTRGFYYQHRILWNSWLAAWAKAGILSEPHAPAHVEFWQQPELITPVASAESANIPKNGLGKPSP